MPAAVVKPSERFFLAERASLLIGAATWLSAMVYLRPNPRDVLWAKGLLLLAALVLVPLVLRLLASRIAPAEGEGLWFFVGLIQLPAAIALTVAFALPQGVVACGLSLPWLVTMGLLALIGLRRLVRHRGGPLSEICLAAGMVYGVVGSGWAVLDRAGVRPLGFEPVIVLLTAIHFHYAGLLLPALTGFAAREIEGRAAATACVGVIVGVPLVAVGITATQVDLGVWLECSAAWLTSAAGLMTAALYVGLAGQPRWPRAVRGLWCVAASALTLGMVLAALYAARFLVPLPWLDIPWMRAVHGTANAMGFTLAALVGWCLADSR
jgi:YndJ-like protein